MDASAPTTATDANARAMPQLRAVLVCDLADSTALIERIGDAAAAELMRRHDRVARDLLHRHAGREIDKTDGYLALFERPLQAVAFALAYQRALRDLGAELKQPLRARTGIHVGEVMLWDNAAADVAGGAKQVEVEGLAKPVAARLMGLAQPGQILLSEMARTLAQRAHAELEGADTVRWIAHGRYRFKGVPVPMMVHEVGESGFAPLSPPASGSKAQRELPPWRKPAALALQTVLLLVAIAIPIYLSVRTEPAIAFAERDWVVMADVNNLTSQPLLTDSLDVALRIGLEQSRYVNVVPTTSMRESLKRMRRPADSVIDRQLGVEIAQREGARALILPSVAEVGGRVRVTAEVIDPISGATVYSEAVGDAGLESVLASTDEVLRRLRERLGESMDAMQRDTQPLDRITTDSLDALKAFALGETALGEGRIKDAMAMMAQAVAIDPDFAMAHARQSTLHHALGDDALAFRAAQQAMIRPQHLSTRERLMLESVVAFYSAPATAREKWSTLVTLYPDIPVAQNNIGLAYLWFENDARSAAPHFREFAQSGSHLSGYGWLGLGVALTMAGDYEGARSANSEARRIGVMAPNFDDVLVHIAERDYAASDKRLDASIASLPPPFALERLLRKAAIALDRGRYRDAAAILQSARDDLPASFPEAARQRVALQRLVVGFVLDPVAEHAALDDYIDTELARIEPASAALDRSPVLHLAIAATIAQRADPGARANSVLERARPHATEETSPPAAKLWRSAACEIQLSAQADARARCLSALVDGFEFVQTRYALMHALREAGQDEAALQQADWLIGQRGRALAELQKLDLQFLNLMCLNEALVLRAELLHALGRADQARSAVVEIDKVWSEGIDATPLAERLASLRRELFGQKNN